MKKIEPSKITVRGNTDLVSKGALKYAKVVWDTYNYGFRKKMDYKFKG